MPDTNSDEESARREDPAPEPKPVDPLETEVKFRTDADGQVLVEQSPLLGQPEILKSQSLRSIYFDTKNLDLLKNGVVLRVRKTGRSSPVMCVKFGGLVTEAPFQRREIEVSAPVMRPDLELFAKDTAAELSHILGGQPIEAQFEMQIKRRVRKFSAGTLSVEVAIDEGVIALPDGRQKPLREVELELKSGEPGDLYDLAHRLATELPLILDFASKPEKGFALLRPKTCAPTKAAPVALDQHASLDMAVVTVISSTLGQFVRNWDSLRETDDPESIHQLRVSLRRMRSALKMLKRVLRCQAFDEVRSEAKRIASALGTARELDSFILGVAEGPMRYSGKMIGCTDLTRAADSARAKAYLAARALIDERQTSLFVLKVKGLVARHAWRNELSSSDLSVLTQSARVVASSMLDWLHGRALKRGRRLMERNDEERHELRIALKDLRYGVEFFSSLFGHSRRVRTLLKAVSQLQDLLGSHNDTVSAERLVLRLSDGLGPEAARAAGYIIGWHARAIPLADAKLDKTWKEFKGQRPFWH